MATDWIQTLATEIKDKGKEAAETYGRDQHRAGIVAAEGKVFFTALLTSLEQDLNEMRSQLQGSAVASETTFVKGTATQATLKRSRFPWFDATLKHQDGDLIFDYVQGRGVPGQQDLLSSTDHQAFHYTFQVDAQDRLSVAESFGEATRQFTQPEELARHMIELLFKI